LMPAIFDSLGRAEAIETRTQDKILAIVLKIFDSLGRAEAIETIPSDGKASQKKNFDSLGRAEAIET